MDTKAKHEHQSVEELIAFFSPLFSQSQTGASDNLSIPGMDAYVPSHVAGGADQRRIDGQLEPDSQRDQ